MSKIKHIPGLTPLRGLAALLVLIGHYEFRIASVLDPNISPVLGKTYLMVDLFFVLSGFVMYHVYGDFFKEKLDFGRFKKFMRARFARIYPLHVLTLLLVVGVALIRKNIGKHEDGFFDVVFDFSALPSQLLMTQAMGTHHEATWNTPSWSISTEWWAYVLFPLIILFFARSKSWSRWLLAASIIGGYISIMYYFQPQFWALRWEQLGIPESVPYPMHIIDVITGPAFLRCMCGFVFGMLLYELYVKNWGAKILQSGWLFLGTWVLLFVLWHFEILPDPVAVFIFGIMILSAAYCKDRVSKGLNSKPFVFLGDISYSLYLIHMPLLFGFEVIRKIMVDPDPYVTGMLGYDFPPLAAWAGLFLLLVLSLGLASLSYYYFETPMRKWLKKSVVVDDGMVINNGYPSKLTKDTLLGKP